MFLLRKNILAVVAAKENKFYLFSSPTATPALRTLRVLTPLSLQKQISRVKTLLICLVGREGLEPPTFSV